MGLISKARTASRTAERRVPNAVVGSSNAARLMATDAVIRSVAAKIGGVSRSSTVLRGHTSKLVTAFGVGDVSSDFWFEVAGQGQWLLSLGADSSAGVALDWQVRCASVTSTTAPVGPALSLSTPKALTTDGALVKADVHDNVRQLITSGVSTAAGADQQPLVAVSEAGYRTPTNGMYAPTPASFVDHFTISTGLPYEQLVQRLALIPGTRGEPTDAGFPYQLGIRGTEAALAVLTVADTGARREIEGTVTFRAAGRRVSDEVAHRRAAGFADTVLGVVRLWQTEADLSRPTLRGEQTHG